MLNLLFWACFFTIAPGVFWSIVSKKRIELFLAPSLMGNALLLYVFGWFGFLKPGLYFSYILNIGILLATVFFIIYHFYCRNKNFFKRFCFNVLTPGLFLFLLGLIFSYFVSEGRRFYLCDEFSHWGRVAKIIYDYDVLPLKDPDALKHIHYKSYPYGVALLEYIFAKSYNAVTFVPSTAYFAVETLFLAMFTSLIAKLQWRNIGTAVLIFTSAFIVCLHFEPHFFTSLYVDVILGCEFAVLWFYLIYSRTTSYWNYILLSIVGAFMLLTKASGTGLFIMILFVSTGTSLCYLYKLIATRRGKYAKKLLYSLLPYSAFVIYFMQTQLTRGLKPYSFGNDVTFDRIFNAWVFNFPDKFDTIYNKMFSGIFTEKKVTLLPFPVSYFLLIVFISVIIFVIAKNLRYDIRHRMTAAAITYFTGFFIYAISLLILYVFRFSSYEGVRLASFTRYMSTYIVAGLLFLFACIGICMSYRKNCIKYCLLLLFVPFFNNVENISQTLKRYLNNRSIVLTENFVEQATHGRLTNGERFFGIWQKTPAGYKYLIMSLNYPRNFSTGGSYGPPQYPGDVWSKNISVEKFSDMVKNNNFCYVDSSSDSFAEKYGNFFECEKIIERCLYQSKNGKLYPLPNKQFYFNSASFLSLANKKRAVAKYSADRSSRNIKIMKNGEITLTNIPEVPLSNGQIEAFDIELADINGNVNFQLIFDGVVFVEEELNSQNHLLMKKAFAPQNVKKMALRFYTKNNSSSFKIKGILLKYADAPIKMQKSEKNIVLDSNNPVHKPRISDWSSPLRKPINSGFSVNDKNIACYGSYDYVLPLTGKFRLTAKIKNKGNKATSIYFGFNVKNDKKWRISSASSSVPDTNTELVAAAKNGDSKIYVKSAKTWKKHHRVVFYAKEDFSDLPNYTYRDTGEAWINSIKKQSDEKWEISLKQPLRADVPEKTPVRQHSHGEYNYLYTSSGKLMPGEEKVFSGQIVAKNPPEPGFSVKKGWPIGAKYASLILLSYAPVEHEIEIRDVQIELIQQDTANKR